MQKNTRALLKCCCFGIAKYTISRLKSPKRVLVHDNQGAVRNWGVKFFCLTAGWGRTWLLNSTVCKYSL
jgi:hypothetical protein